MSPVSGGRIRVTLGPCLLAAVCEGFDLQAAAVCGSGIARELAPTPNALSTLFSANGNFEPSGEHKGRIAAAHITQRTHRTD